MDTLLINNRNEVLQALKKTEESILKDVNIIKNWIKTQPHLPEIPNNRLIENFLISNKFSIEKTKTKLDMYYTIRTLIPECFKHKNPSLPHMQKIAQIIYYFPLPKLTKELYRVNIAKVTGDPKFFDVNNFFGYQLNINEIRFQEEINLGDVVILDLQETTLGHLIKISPVHLKKAVMILEKVYSNRIKQIHLINVPNYVDKLVLLLKSVLNPKIFERVHLHASPDTLLKYMSDENLPEDYGGNQLSLNSFKELWKQKVEQYSDRFEKLEAIKVNERLRPILLKNDEILGYYGNFKTLDVD